MTEDWPTLAAVHRQLQGLRGDVQELCVEMRHGRRELDDHERRLRSLSRWRWWVAGGLAAVATLGTAAGVPMIGG